MAVTGVRLRLLRSGEVRIEDREAKANGHFRSQRQARAAKSSSRSDAELDHSSRPSLNHLLATRDLSRLFVQT